MKTLRFSLIRTVILQAVTLYCALFFASKLSYAAPRATPADQPIADELLLDQDGRQVHFYRDVIRGQQVVINFMFTSCAMVCPPLSALNAQLIRSLGADSNVRVVSVSLDPENDTPEKLLAHRAKYLTDPSIQNRWTLLTGKADAINKVLASLGQSSTATGHEPVHIIGSDARAKWVVTRGLGSVSTLKKALFETGGQAGSQNAAAKSNESKNTFRNYFTDTMFTDQDGHKQRLYTDLLKGKKVLINFGFTRCTAVCSPATRNLAAVQKKLGKRMGKDIVFLTFTVDPDHDTPEVLRRYADKNGAGPGWYFLTAARSDVEAVLKKIGGWTELPDNHSGVLMYGDVDQGVWSKSSSMDQPSQIAYAIANIGEKNVM